MLSIYKSKIQAEKMNSKSNKVNKLNDPISNKGAGMIPAGTKKLRTELRRVMSDRVLKITMCSQQQTVEKIKQRQNPDGTSSGKLNFSQNDSKIESPMLNDSKLITKDSSIQISPKIMNKISLLPFKTFGSENFFKKKIFYDFRF